MRSPAANDGPSERFRRVLRGALAWVMPVVFVGFYLTNAEGEASAGARVIAVLQRLLMLGLGCAVMSVAGLFGMRLLRLMRVAPERLLVRFVLGVGLGLGTIALATLGLGCAGLVGPAASGVLLGAMFLAGLGELRPVGDFLRGRSRTAMTPLSYFELLLVFVFLFAVLLGVLLAFNLPTDYDACEYHLAGPARWFQTGRIDFIPGNVFSNFPMNAEMLYLFSMGLAGHLMLGVHLAVVMNALVSAAAAGAVSVLARRLVARTPALAAMTLFFTMPWVMVTSTINIYNEMTLALYLTLAVYAFLEFAETPAVRWAVLSAVFAGLASGVKWTALGFLPLGLGVTVVFAARGMPLVRRIALGVLYAAVVTAVVSPWFARNLAFTGNPVYPFFYRHLGGRDWSAEQDAKWIAGQVKAARADRAGNIFRATWDRVVAEPFGSFAIFVLLVPALVAVRERPVRWLLVFLVLWTLFWYFGTHRVGRFWLPMMGCAAALAGRGFGVFRWKWVAHAVAAALIGALGYYVYVDASLAMALAPGSYDLGSDEGNYRVLARPDGYGLYPLVVFAHTLKPTDRLMLVGEAQSLYLPPNVSCSTVFDREVFTATVGSPGDPAVVRERLHEAGVTHLFVNWAEIGRLRETYAYPGPDGRTRPGFPPLSPHDLNRLVEAGVLKTLPEWEFPRVQGGVRGLSSKDVAELDDGRIAMIYAVR